MPDADAVDRYDEWHRARGGKQPPPVETWHQMVIRQVGDVAGLRVLEIGSGRGSLSRYLADCGAHITAADFSPAAIDIARIELAGCQHADAIVADCQAIPFPDRTFDLVISCETLEHLPKPWKGLHELVRVTKFGGRLIVTTPNYLSPLGLYRLLLTTVARKEFRETGQPINQPLTLLGRMFRLRRYGCRIVAVDGEVMNLPIPRFRVVYLPFTRPKWLMKWFCTHCLTHAVRMR